MPNLSARMVSLTGRFGKRVSVILLFIATVPFRALAGDPPPGTQVERLIFVRHAEKPAAGLGQLSPLGLRRSLELPNVLLSRFGHPACIFAPNPAEKIQEQNGLYYDYVRPLATIEPTAIRCGLPVNASIGYSQLGALREKLTRKELWNSTVFICWEHIMIHKSLTRLLKRYGIDTTRIPKWNETDYDSIFILTITRQPGKPPLLHLEHQYEGLNP